jgi:alpha-tubulin suppressor-like RCC1 family protein
MKDIENTKKEAPLKEAPFLGLTGMGGGVASLMWHSAAGVGPFNLWVLGNNQYGVLGQNQAEGYLEYCSSPIQIPGDWQTIGNGNSSQIGTKPDGTLWTWGRNNYGQLGHNDTTLRSSPTQIPGTDWAACNAGGYHMMAVKTDGSLYLWGKNNYGELGVNDKTNYSSPKQIPGTWGITQDSLCGGDSTSQAIKADGTMWMWGTNQQGQLFQNTRSGGPGTPNQIDGYSSPRQVGNNPSGGWKVAGGGGNVMFAIDNNDDLWACGGPGARGNGDGQSIKKSSPTQVPSSNWSVIAPSMDGGKAMGVNGPTGGSSVSWGFNPTGVLGINRSPSSPQPGSDFKETPVTILGGITFTKMAMGPQNAWGVSNEGKLYAWGTNGFGGLGQNQSGDGPNYSTDPEARSQPVQIGTSTNWNSVRAAGYTVNILENQ